jgi:hypothetical protein
MLYGYTYSYPLGSCHMKIEDFGHLQTRYQSLTLASRAAAVLADAEPALQTAERILGTLAESKQTKEAFDRLRKNSLLIGKMRPSDAKVMLMDSTCDFVAETTRKVGAWRKTMERLSKGEAIMMENNKEFISMEQPLAMAVQACMGLSGYIAIVQLALTEMAKLDAPNANKYASMTSEIRRCATVLSDYENASSFQAMVH